MPNKDEIKFTDEELESVSSYQKQYTEIQLGFGQIEMTRNRLDDQYESLDKSMEDLRTKLSDIQKEERSFIDSINKKYGDGVLNPETGVFVPNKA